MSQVLKLAVAAIFISFVTGCASTRGVVDVNEVDVSKPVTGTDVKFVAVADARDFQIEPRSADIPSLKYGEINNDAITSRAIARKRNGFGKALGDILLPEDKTVMEVVENQLAKSFNSNGYRVLSPSDSGYSGAVPLNVDIIEFWGWFSPGFWSIGISFDTAVRVTGPLAEFRGGVLFESNVEKRYQTAVTSNWKEVLELSLRELRKDVDTKLKLID